MSVYREPGRELSLAEKAELRGPCRCKRYRCPACLARLLVRLYSTEPIG